MRPMFLRSLMGAGLALVLAIPASAMQIQLRTPEGRAEKERQKQQQAQAEAQKAQAAEAAQKPGTETAGECLPDGRNAKAAVNTLEDILVMASFGLPELTVPAAAPVANEDPVVVEWRPVSAETAKR